MSIKLKPFKLFSILAVLAMIFSNVQLHRVEAQSGDGLERQVNAESGRVSFIAPAHGKSLSAERALGQSIRPQDPAMALAAKYGPEFGLQDAERSLTAMDSNRSEDGRLTVRFQQNFENVPVMGGELIVNTNDNGDLYSISGEVSPGLSLSTQPDIDARSAQDTALQAMAKWYGKTPEDFAPSEPELWIYDESLLQPSTRPVELTWRMEITAKDAGMPVRELVLVNAQRDSVSLHFNQMDTAWHSDRQVQLFLRSPMSRADLTGNIRYVATTGSDSSDCSNSEAPCASINAAITNAIDGDTIKVAVGTYTGFGTEVVLINKNVTLSGGWDASFTTQTGRSIIDGQDSQRGIWITANQGVSITTLIERFTIQNANVDTGVGGGIRNDGNNVTLNDSIVQNNFGMGGAGIANEGTMIINHTTVSHNTGGHDGWSGGSGGGGIFNGGTLTVNNSTISDNTLLGSFDGSGILTFGTIYLNNTTVSGNTGGSGAGIYTFVGTIILNNSTISYNQRYGFYSTSGHVTLQNTVIAKNGYLADCINNTSYSGTVTSLGNNVVGNGEGCSLTPVAGDKIGTGTRPIDPLLTHLQDNGGPTLTHALMTGSAAIDAGNPNTCLPFDQRGIARPVGAKCDMGAFEGEVPYVPMPKVNTYDGNHSIYLPGGFLCNESDPGCLPGDAHAKAAHRFAIGTFNFYVSNYARNSIDNAGMIIKSTVHHCTLDSTSGTIVCPYANAYWDGEQMVYGDAYGFPLADDVVAHELTHGVTQYESNLFYYYQSGAINESFSDLWGEYYDQTNGQGTDTADMKWLVGEDITGLGAIRSMSNPPAYGDPDKMTSPQYKKLPYYDADWDSGGVHSNSGVNNKAVYLMVDGGSFNGKTVTGLGWEKAGEIYYQVNTNLLTSGADYSDLYYALQLACKNLIGKKGIVAGDCTQVRYAADAVEMNAQPVANYNPNAPFCTVAGTAPQIQFAEDVENGLSKWTFSNGAHARWQLDSPIGLYAHSGNHSLYADDYPALVTDAKATLSPFVVPENAYLWFAQAYEFEFYTENYDGGVLEFSINSGSTWNDASALIDTNGYKGIISAKYGNPLGGRSAFVGSSHGYTSTRLNLSTLAGKTVRFRWRMGLDGDGYALGWWVDDVKMYTCGEQTTFVDVPKNHPYYNDIEILYANGLTGGCASNPLKFCPDQIMNRGQAAVFILRGNFGSSYVPPTPVHYFQDDWTKGTWAEPWAEGMKAESLSAGCLVNPPKYCPWDQIPREQAVIFGLRMKYGTLYTPPPATGTVFADMTNPGYYSTAWAEQAYKDGIIKDCGIDGVSGKPKFCPKGLVSRGLAAYMIVRAKNLTMP